MEIITLGMPTGSACMAGVSQRRFRPSPPAEMTPATSPWRASQDSNASAIAATDRPRSPVKTSEEPRGCDAATTWGGTSADDVAPEVDRSTVFTATPSAISRSRMKPSSAPLVSNVPAR